MLFRSYPRSNDSKDLEAAKFADDFFNNSFLDPAIKGEFPKGLVSTLEKDNVLWNSTEVESLVTLEKDNCSMELNDYDMSIIKQAQEKDFNAIELSITLSENTLLKSARAFLIVKDLEEIGEIIKSKPSTEDIENEDFELQLDFVLITTSSEDEVKKLVENISEVRMVETKLIEFQKIEESAVKPKEVKLEPKEVTEEKKKSVKKEGYKKSHQSVRVDLERIDKLMNMVSELVIYRTRLEQIVVDHKSSDLTETLEQVGRTTTDLQDLVMKIRMLPLDTVFNRFPRMIRDISDRKSVV